MNSLPEVLHLSSLEEADRLWKGAREAFPTAGVRLVSMCASIDLGLRAAELYALSGLRQTRHAFSPQIRHHLEAEDPRVHWQRDALGAPPCVDFKVLLDLMSAPELDCIAPEAHEDGSPSHFSCERSRAAAKAALGFSLSGEDRDLLLLLLAYRNRIFRCAPPVELRKDEVLVAFPALAQLVERLQAAATTAA